MSGLEQWFDIIDPAGLAEWVASRPKVVRDLLAQFPLTSKLELRGEVWIVMGATEGGSLIIAPASSESYDDAMEKRQFICGDCQRRDVVHWVQR